MSINQVYMLNGRLVLVKKMLIKKKKQQKIKTEGRHSVWFSDRALI